VRKSFKALGLGLTLLAMGTIGWLTAPVHAEEDGGIRDTVTDMRGVNAYHWFWYPSSRTYFELEPKYETRFDIHNGMFAEVYYREFYPQGELDQLRAKSGDLYGVHMRVNMSFYTPNGEFLGEYKEIQPNIMYNIPQNRHSREFDRIQVKLENYTRADRELRVLVVDHGPGTVMGTPIPGVWREP
jgi:hypothetical protein